MHTISTSSLTGINQINNINLTGKSFICEKLKEPYYVTRIKKVIFNRFITPLFTKNWSIIEQNIFSVTHIKQKLEKYINDDGHEELHIYLGFLNVILELLGEHNHFENLEKIYNPKDAIGTIKFKVPNIRLKPEYELYKLIIGKPKKFKDYDKQVLQFIVKQLNNEYAEFDSINESVKKEFNL